MRRIRLATPICILTPRWTRRGATGFHAAMALQVVVSGLNLNNEVFGFYQGAEQYPIQREYYNRTIAAGLRWTPFYKERP